MSSYIRYIILFLGFFIVRPGGGAEPSPAASGSPPTDIVMSLRIQVTRDGQQMRVAPGDTLYCRDLMELFVRVNQPVYLYIVEFYADGSREFLFPAASDVQIQADTELRIPELGNWLELDDSVGEDHIYLIASVTRLSHADQTVESMVENVRLAALKPQAVAPAPAPKRKKPGPPPKPGIAPASTMPAPQPAPLLASAAAAPTRAIAPELAWNARAIHLVSADRQRVVQAIVRPKGASIYLLSFKHARAGSAGRGSR